MTVNLEKELINANKKRIAKELSQSEKLLQSASEALSDSVQNDKIILESYGMREALKNVDSAKLKNEEIRKIAKINNNRIFSEDDIKKIAVAYGLRFLPSNQYIGSFPADLPQKLREAEKDIKNNGLHITIAYSIRSYILAPKENFKLQEKPKDPLMFIKLSNGLYYLAHKWGDDLNIGRWLVNFPKRNFQSLLLVFLVILILPVYCLLKPLLSFILFSSLFFCSIFVDMPFNDKLWNSSLK